MQRVFSMTAADMGLVFTLAGAVTVVVRGVLVGRIVKMFGEPSTVRAGCLLLAVSVGMIAFIPNRWWLALLVPLWAIATGMLFPSLHSLISRATDEYSQGSVLGGSQLAGGLGRVVGPLWAGALFQTYAIGSPFLVGASLSTIAVILSVRIPSPHKQDVEEKIEPGHQWGGPVTAHDSGETRDSTGS